MTDRNNIDIDALCPPGLNSDYDLPPWQQLPPLGTRLATVNMLGFIEAKVAKLAALGLCPHPNLIGYRQELEAQLEAGGPYKLRSSSGWF
jgi:hypothetical protein